MRLLGISLLERMPARPLERRKRNSSKPNRKERKGTSMNEGLKEQVDALFVVFEEAVIRLMESYDENFTWVDAIADVMSLRDWSIISRDREGELETAERHLRTTKAVLARAYREVGEGILENQA